MRAGDAGLPPVRRSRLAPALAVVLAGFAAVAFAQGPSAAQDPEVEELEVAGIPVLLKRVAANEVISAQLFLRGGAGSVTAETAGIDRFLLEASKRGTAKYSKDAFVARLAATGTRLDAASGYDYSVFAMQTIRDSWDEGWDLFTEALLRPTLPPAEVELVRAQLLNAVRQRRDNPDAYVRDLSDSLFYLGHPYARNPEGTETALSAITQEQLRDRHTRRLAKDDLLLVVVGDVAREDLEAKVTSALGSLPDGAGVGRPVELAAPAGPEVAIVQRGLPTTYVRGTFAAPGLSDEDDYAALTVALSILSDRLFEEVRTKRNLSYAVFSGLSSRLSNYGVLYVSSIEPDSALSVMLAEVRKLQEVPVPSDALAQAVKVFVTEYYLGLEANASQAALLGRYELLGGGWEEAEDFVEEVRRVTPEDLQRVMRAYVGGIRFAVLGDPDKVDRALFTSM